MAQVGAASLRRVTRDRKTLSGRRGRRAIGGLPVCNYFSRCRVLTKLYDPSRGTEGSNPASSSGEARANLKMTSTFRCGVARPSLSARARQRHDETVGLPSDGAGCRTAREREGSAALARSGLAFFGERPGGLLEVLGEIELQGGGLHCNLALELIHIPAAAADGCAHREWRVLRHFRGELVGDFEVPAFRRDAVDDAGCESLFGGEEAAGQGHLSRKGGGAAEIQ